jgi:aryl-alcohol dehydrogenase-like predicted oxidoreductase
MVHRSFGQSGLEVSAIRALAKEIGAAPAQIALAWLLHLYQGIAPIPGTTSLEHLEGDAAAVQVHLTEQRLAKIAGMTPGGSIG